MRSQLIYLLALSWPSMALPATPDPAISAFEWHATRLIEPRQCPDKGREANSGAGKHWGASPDSTTRAQPSKTDAVVSISQNNLKVVDEAVDDTARRTTQTSTRTVTQVQTKQPEPTTQQPSPSPTPQPAPVDSSNRVDDSGTRGKISGTDPKALLRLHNDYRAARQAGPLTWNNEMEDFATKYALACESKHSGGPYGENLAFGSGAGSPDGLFKMWSDEEKDYNPNDPTYSHYTQVVWKGAKQLGCAMITCPAGALFEANYGESTFLICEYDTGNVAGQYKENVG